jgi:ketosteroid isomerase-like protein
MGAKLTPDVVKGEVQRFWNVFVDKNADQLMEFYGPESSVFSSVTSRQEPGRLAAARRQREYFQKHSVLRAIPSMIDVIMLSDHAAVASYNFTFHASKIATITGGNNHDEDIKNGRATQVFQYDSEGKLRILHEHLSSVDKH